MGVYTPRHAWLLTSILGLMEERVECKEYGPYRVVIPRKLEGVLYEKYHNDLAVALGEVTQLSVKDRILRVESVEEVILGDGDTVLVEQLPLEVI